MNTKLTIREIEEVLVSYWGGPQNVLCVPNVYIANIAGKDYDYEADLLMITKAGFCIEFEIKRSYSDLMAEAKKDKCTHKAPFISSFYYVLPHAIKDKAREFFETTGTEHHGLVYYTEEKKIFFTGGNVSTKGRRKMTVEEMYKVARLGTLRYWNLRNKTEMK